MVVDSVALFIIDRINSFNITVLQVILKEKFSRNADRNNDGPRLALFRRWHFELEIERDLSSKS